MPTFAAPDDICPSCKRPVDKSAIKCPGCGRLQVVINFQPPQWEVVDKMRALGPDVATKLAAGGSRGSTKSRLGRDLALLGAFENHNKTIYVILRNYGDIEDIWLKKYRLERPQIMQYWHGTEIEFRFPTDLGGSTVAFRAADTHEDVVQMTRGPEAFWVIVDQAEMFTAEELQMINGYARWPSAEPGQVKTLYLFNPGGRGAYYLRRVFYLRTFEETENPSDYWFRPMFGFDNWYWYEKEVPELTYDSFWKLTAGVPPCLDGVYDNAWLDTVPDHYRFKLFVTRTSEGRKQWEKPYSVRLGDLFGSFDKFAGQYFGDVWDERLCVIKPAVVDALIPYWVPCWLSGDYGFGHYACFHWFCISKLSPDTAAKYLGIETDLPVEVVIAYREYSPPLRTSEPELGQAIVDRTPVPERRALRKFVMGSDVNKTLRFADHSIKEMIEAITVPAGLPEIQNAHAEKGSRAVNARLLWNMIRQTKIRRSGAKADVEKNGVPLLLISAECPHLISGIPLMNTDPKNVESFEKIESVYDASLDSCFVAGTLISTTYGPRPIEDIGAFDAVWTRKGAGLVRRAWAAGVKDVVEAKFSDGVSVTCTSEHKFWIEAGWRPLDTIGVGELVQIQHGTVELLSVVPKGKQLVYDLEVDGEHEYFANGLLVHNCKYGAAEYLEAASTAPREVRREEFVNQGANMQAQYLRSLEFDANERSSRIRPLRR